MRNSTKREIVLGQACAACSERESARKPRCACGIILRTQVLLLVCRLAKQRFREARVQFQDYIILLMAGACLGPLSNMRDTSLGTGGYFYTLIALGMPPLCVIVPQPYKTKSTATWWMDLFSTGGLWMNCCCNWCSSCHSEFHDTNWSSLRGLSSSSGNDCFVENILLR